tara:strand:+ start:1308 stop:1973 length:666 start_codon:yes stop_codon:yes gene_type:complete
MALPEEVEKALSAMFAGVGAGAGAAARGVRKASSRAVRETAKSPTAEQLQQFEDQHATPFDPDSSMDRGKMLKIMSGAKKPQEKKTAAEMAEEIPDLPPDVGGYGLPVIKTGRETDSEELESRDEIAEVLNKKEDSVGFVSPGIPSRKELERKEAEASPELLESLFRTTHGGPFDPKSSMDKKKMEQIKELLSSGEDFGDLSDKKMRNRFALKIYRNYDYV